MIEEDTIAEERRSEVPRLTHLSGMTPEEMAALLGIKRYQARQIFKWIHGKQVFDFDRMSNLSKELRQTLSAKYKVCSLGLLKALASPGSGTWKVLLRLDDPTVPLSDENLQDLRGPIGAGYPDLLSIIPCVVSTGVDIPPDVSPTPSLVLRASPIPFRNDLELFVAPARSSVLPRRAAGEGAMLSARVAVYDVAGRQIRVLYEGPLASEGQQVTWNGRDQQGRRVSSGVYFVRATAGRESVTRSVVLLR